MQKWIDLVMVFLMFAGFIAALTVVGLRVL